MGLTIMISTDPRWLGRYVVYPEYATGFGLLFLTKLHIVDFVTTGPAQLWESAIFVFWSKRSAEICGKLWKK